MAYVIGYCGGQGIIGGWYDMGPLKQNKKKEEEDNAQTTAAN